MKTTKAIKVALYGMLVALAFVFSYIEVLIPFNFQIPGIKLGLANIVVLVALYTIGYKGSFVISCIRIILTGFTFGNMFSILYSLAGGLLSFAVMSLCKKSNKFSTIGVSVAGGITHNIGQIIVASIVLETASLKYYLPALLIAGTVTGILIGMLGAGMLNVQRKVFSAE
jgi:heptaprenyl diphosphate synthase